MQKDTARTLLQTIADTTSYNFDVQHKLIALEKVLEEYEPEIFNAYNKELQAIRKQPPFSVNPDLFSSLQKRLAEDR